MADYVQVGLWSDEQAQACGWKNMEDAGYVEELTDPKNPIYLPVTDPDAEDFVTDEDVSGRHELITYGMFLDNRLYTEERHAVVDENGDYWILMDEMYL